MTIRSGLYLALTLASIAITTHANAQGTPNGSQTMKPVANDSSIFGKITLGPQPSATRAANGAPGPKYWQNRADYDLKATIDTVTGTVQGAMNMRYTNNSPNTLDFIWIQTEQNRFRDNKAAGRGNSTLASTYGDIIEEFTQLVNGKPAAVQLEEHKTETKVTLPQPLKPGATANFSVKWHFVVPLNGDRMSRAGSLYQIAQWYPRVNVYDDVKGWNIEPYLGTGEFFLEYGDFTMEVTVPATYIVAATGTLDNPADVLTPTQRTRLAQAAVVDTVINIITADELTNGAAHLKQDGMLTWKFHAKNVRDAVFAASPQYQWDATSWKGIITQAYYRPKSAQSWSKVADMARMSIQEFSERWFQYPYPQVSVLEGPVGGGMEYPMVSFDGVFPEATQYLVTTHEIGHNWFPMIVGSNERVHGWMDEGLNSFIDHFSVARRYPQKDQTVRADHDRASVEARVKANRDVVMQVPADSSPDNQYTAYDKPSGVLQMLRRDVLGPEVFDKAMREYITRWAYKHPTPQDFFRTMEDVSGQNKEGNNLAWFWREWFLSAPGFDQTIDSVQQKTDAKGSEVKVVYGNKRKSAMPLLVRFTFSDSTTQDVVYPADIWRSNNDVYKKSYTFPKAVAQIVVDPDHHIVDSDRANNVWVSK